MRLTDTNNKIPEFQGLSPDNRYNFEVQENQPSGTVVATIEASDADNVTAYKQVCVGFYKFLQ